ncbi:MAG: hypothetical protein K8R68_10305, partial [Bacteroidales bacterium]|nr:hypothetical protein [Bacteroidales bacterium]
MKTSLSIILFTLITFSSFSKPVCMDQHHIILIKFDVPDDSGKSSDDLKSSDEYSATQDRTAQFNPFHHQTFDDLLFEAKYKQMLYAGFVDANSS